MPQKATNPGVSAPLSTQQIKVVNALLAGSTVTKAATSAKVNRTTVHRWLREDWNFQATLNRGKIELSRAATARLTALADKQRGLGAKNIELPTELKHLLVQAADGDARQALNYLEI